MPRRRKKKTPRLVHQSIGPLPWRLAGQFAGRLLVFSDASQKRQGGIAAVFFAEPDGQPLLSSRSVPLNDSQELELQAALFALQQSGLHFPDQPPTLFSDNQDVVCRLNRAKEQGWLYDPELGRRLAALAIAGVLDSATIRWIKGHGSCRGNTLADQLAGAAAA